MGRASNRKRTSRQDVRNAVTQELASLPKTPGALLLVAEACDMPETKALAEAAGQALTAAIPATFEHEGQIFYMRASVMARIEIFDAPATSKPLAEIFHADQGGYGHRPAS